MGGWGQRQLVSLEQKNVVEDYRRIDVRKTAVAKVRKRGLSGTELTSLLAQDAVEVVGRASPAKG